MRAGILLCRIVKRFRGGLVFKAHRLLYHSTLGLRVIKQKKKQERKGNRGRLRSERGGGGGVCVTERGTPCASLNPKPLSARSSSLFYFTHLTIDSLGPPQGEVIRKDARACLQSGAMGAAQPARRVDREFQGHLHHRLRHPPHLNSAQVRRSRLDVP